MSIDDSGSWLTPFKEFFQKAELHQSLRSLQIETIVFPYMPPADFDNALRSLCSGIQSYLKSQQESSTTDARTEVSFAATEQKATAGSNDLDIKYKHISREITQSALTKEQTQQLMDDFVERQWVEINANNRDEFLIPEAGRDTTCARTDAKDTNRGVQIQLDVVRNDNDALGRSTHVPDTSSGDKDPGGIAVSSKPLEGLSERVDNIREHLNVVFVPESANIYRRVSALEDRIMLLEREFPPWSAQHFNQPGRRYTQPPPATIYRILPAPEPEPESESAAGKGALAAAGSASSIIGKYSARISSVPATADSVAMPFSKARTTAGSAYTRSTMTSTLAAATATSASGGSSSSSHTHLGKQPRRYSGSPSVRSSPALKRRRTGQILNSPVDSSGKPIFHSCGRGVNSSLTRSVLAQLQNRHGTVASKDLKDPKVAAAPGPIPAPPSTSTTTSASASTSNATTK
ncbi:hypothetical protein LPJ64_001487 [Coemansia asiatica]|uniref:Uncharacterized protein n=1 Tax=Coemansia asiatica TaxID=1052880 RepID=A0A9W8CJY1_9FUNG|nr:hypothetical protein LPJ64_001487 [Coemansia asiatica]